MKENFILSFSSYYKPVFFLVFVFCMHISQAFAQTLNVVSPNGAEKLLSNTAVNITWKSNDIQNIKIEYSLDNGINWEIVSYSFPAFIGSYNWTLPPVISQQVKIKISDVNSISILDLSDDVFQISSAPFQGQDSIFNISSIANAVSGTLDMTSPDPASNGATILEAGTNTNITWTSSGISQINIEYSINGGVNWNTIASNVNASLGSHSWSIPSNIQPTTQLVIKLTEVGGSVTDQNANFVFIKNPQPLSGLMMRKAFSGSTTRILPFGDSITHGRKSSTPPDIVAGNDAGYEFKLWDLLRQDNYDFDFIGNKYSGYNYFPDYQNAGFPGYTTQGALDILTSGQHTDFLNNDVFAPDDYLDSFPADVVLVLIGINDDLSTPSAISAAAANVQSILENIHSKNSDTWIVLAKLLKTANAALNTRVEAFNNAIENIANTKINEDYNILIVDMYNIPGFVYSIEGDLYDELHPDSIGYTKMAPVWYNALKLILPDSTPTAPQFSQPSVDISANVGIPLNYQAVASGIGTPQYSLTGTPPSAMTINQYTGKINWTPTSTGNYSATIQATNSSGTVNQTLNIHVYEASNKPSNLISYLKFNNVSETDKFIDEVNTNNAVIEGSLSTGDGRIEKAVSFDGSFQNKAYFLQEESFNFKDPDPTSFTVEAWIKPSSLTGDQVVVGQYSSRGESHWWLGLTGGKPTFQFHKKDDSFTTYSSVTAPSTVSTTNWTHIVGVKGADLDIYVNGVLTDGPSVTGDIKALRPIDIGSYQNTKYYHGLIDEVAIYKGPLDETTIQNHYKNGIYSVQSNVSVFLQGPYNGTDMNTNLRTLSSFPLNQPYSANPWNYPGLESISSLPAPANVVDWVLLELRTGTAASTVVSKRAAFLLNNGSIVGLGGSGAVNLYGVLPGKYYITVKHRNHLAVMTKDPVTLNSSSAVAFNFNNQSQVFGTNPMADLGSGNFGMYAGDVDRNYAIGSSDLINCRSVLGSVNYIYADGDLNGAVGSSDLIIIRQNLGKTTQQP